MKEQEYINTKDLTRLEHALSCLRAVVPEIQPVIPDGELKEIRGKISTWIEKLYKKIEIEDE